MKRLLPLLLGLCLPGLALAADDKAPANNVATPQSFTTEHRADVGGQRMAYKVVAGETVLQKRQRQGYRLNLFSELFPHRCEVSQGAAGDLCV